MDYTISAHIEAMIFTSPKVISLEEITFALQIHFERAFEEEEVQGYIRVLQEKFAPADSAIELVYFNRGYQLLTKEKYYPILHVLQAHREQKKLSASALETLAIIAYRQPVTKLEIEQIRRVNCDYSVQKLLEKELITIAGKAESPGRPILYKTSELFMDYFGINDMRELPQMKDIQNSANVIGELNI